MHNNNSAGWKKLRLAILARDEWTCKTCGLVDESGKGLDVDHIVSKDEAGRLGWTIAEVDDPSNLQTLCQFHNRSKSNKTAGDRVEYWNPLYAHYK